MNRGGGWPGLPAVTPVDAAAGDRARRELDALAKPPGSLGRLEDLAARLAAIAGCATPPALNRPAALVFAADHGVVSRGVSRWPREVTAAMVGQIVAGRAACNAIARVVGASVTVVDVGVATPVTPHPGVTHARVADGTSDMLDGPAMSPAQAGAALAAGADAARAVIAGGADLVCVGDMGIGNTTSAAAVVAALCGADPRAAVGLGASGSRFVRRKEHVVRAALELHRSRAARDVLMCLGGLEHAAIAGAITACAAARVPAVLDGVNAGAAAMCAVRMVPAVHGYLIAGHRSHEPAAALALDHLGLQPVLDLEMRLGEGTGALLAVPAIRAASTLLRDMARLDEVAG